MGCLLRGLSSVHKSITGFYAHQMSLLDVKVISKRKENTVVKGGARYNGLTRREGHKSGVQEASIIFRFWGLIGLPLCFGLSSQPT